MASLNDRINKLGEERIAREKARIEKLRELNLKKYNNKFELPRLSASTVPIPSTSKPDVSSVVPTTSKSDTNTNAINKDTNASKSNKGRFITTLKILRKKVSCKNNATNNVKAPSKDYDKNKVETTVKRGIQECGDIKNNKNVSKEEVTASKIPTNNFKTVNDKKTPGKEIADEKNHEEMVNAVETIGKIVVKDQTEEPKPNMEASKSKTIDGRNGQLSKENNAERNRVGESNLKTIIPVPKLIGTKTLNGYKINNLTTRKSIACMSKVDNKPKVVDRRKTMPPESRDKTITTNSLKVVDRRKTMPPVSRDKTITTNSKESVFDRLYKQKTVYKKPVVDAVTKLKTNPNFLKKLIKNSQMISNLKYDMTNSLRIKKIATLLFNKRSTVFERKAVFRRSLSAIDFKRVPKSELSNCIHKWASSSDNINKDDVDVNEDESLKEEKIVSAVKSEISGAGICTPPRSVWSRPSRRAQRQQSSGTYKYTVTPVRRSHRLSGSDKPLRVCSSIHQAKQLGAEFRPNKALGDNP